MKTQYLYGLQRISWYNFIMKSLLELDQFDLESASKQQVAEVVHALLEQVKNAAVELQSKDEKIQALTYELAYLRRIRYGVKSETFSRHSAPNQVKNTLNCVYQLRTMKTDLERNLFLQQLQLGSFRPHSGYG